jgi:predicted RNA-binding protein with PUA-like domain
MGRKKRYWLFKSEPNVYSIQDLERDGETQWDGVRNYQARNLMRDEMSLGDEVLFYHSRVAPMAIVGRARIVREAHPDPSQFDPASKYFDPKSDKVDPRWHCVDIGFVEFFKQPLLREELKEMDELVEMMLLKKGARLSVQPVRTKEWKAILKRVSSRC